MSFREYLKYIGFVPHRLRFIKGEWVYEVCKREYEFSTMGNGTLDVRYKRGDIEIVYGLEEGGYPPTIIHPKSNFMRRHEWDNLIHSKSNEELYKYLTQSTQRY